MTHDQGRDGAARGRRLETAPYPSAKRSSPFAFRILEALALGLPVVVEDRVARLDLLFREAFPAPEVDLLELGHQADLASRCDDRGGLPGPAQRARQHDVNALLPDQQTG